MEIEEQYNVIFSYLNTISFISEDIWQDAKPYFKTKTVRKGEHLFRIEDDVKDFYFLTSGLARYYYPTEDGKEFNKSFAQTQGHLISSISSVTKQEKSPYSVEVLSDFTALYISYEDWLSLGDKYNSWNKLTLKIYEYLIIKKEKRESDFLLLSATQRYEKFIKEYSMILNIVPNYHIASYLGITEVALSRIRKEMNLT